MEAAFGEGHQSGRAGKTLCMCSMCSFSLRDAEADDHSPSSLGLRRCRARAGEDFNALMVEYNDNSPASRKRATTSRPA